jgi:hypothetical protein
MRRRTEPERAAAVLQPAKILMLFEIVVNSVSAKNTVTGYLSDAEGAPAPATGR